MPRPSEADKERFRSLVPEDHRIQVKPMFGNLGAFVNGNMFMGLFGSDIGVKLSSADQEERAGRRWRCVRPGGTADERLCVPSADSHTR